MKFLTWLFLIIFSHVSFANDSFTPLKNGQEFYGLGLGLSVLEDPTGQLKIEDVNSPKWSTQFKKSTKKVISFGFTDSTIWIRLPLENISTIKNWFLSINFPDLDDITFFKKNKNNVWVKTYAGDNISSEKWELRYKDYTFHLNNLKKEIFFLKIKTRGGMTIPIHIKSSDFFKKSKEVNDLFFGGYLAIILTMFFYNLMIGVVLKGRSFLLYVGYIFFWGILSLIISGFGRYQLINSNYFSNQGMVICIIILMMFFLAFSKRFLGIDNSHPKFLKFYDVNIKLWGIFLISSFLIPLRPNIFVVVVLSSSSLGVILFTGLYLFKEIRSARFFMYSFTLLAVGGILKGLTSTGIIPSNIVTEEGIYMGSIIQLIFLSLGLADKFSHLKEDAIKKEQALKKVTESYAKNLEKEVDEKTKEAVQEKERAESSEKDVSELLHNMGQAVFSINKEGEIIPPVSEYSHKIFGKRIEEGNVFQTLYKDMNQEGEQFYKAKFAIGLSVGADSLQYEMSYDQLPAQVMMLNEQKDERSLKINYSPIIDHEDVVQKLMLIVEDVTEIEKREKETKKIQETANLKVKRLQEIVSNDKKDLKLFLREIKINLDLGEKFSKNNDRESLFGVAHTIKGNARLYSLLGLSSEIHSIEEKLNKEEEILQIILENIKTSVNNYVVLLKEVFGEDVDESFLANDTDDIVISKKTFFSSLEQLKTLSQELKNDSLSNILNALINEDLKKYLGILRNAVSRIANSLQKKIDFEISGDNIFIEVKKASIIKDSLMHIIQNSADHGIEKEGKINVALKNSSKNIEILVSDNGRGIDPEIIYQKGIEKGLVNFEETESYSDQEKIQIILFAGFSTKEQATEFSGRGIGMDVVKSNIQKLEGTIEISSVLGQGTQFKIKIPNQ